MGKYGLMVHISDVKGQPSIRRALSHLLLKQVG